MAGDSHTGFDSGAFTAGAVGGAVTLAAALGAGWANHRARQQDRWSGWTVQQLQAALDCSEAMRFAQFGDLRKSRAENAQLKRAAADRAFVFKRDAARATR